MFQSVNNNIHKIDTLHNFNCGILFIILIFVTLCFVFIILNKFYWKSININFQLIELFLALIPIFLCVIIYYGSVCTTYSVENSEIFNILLAVKVVGHQWYWRYNINGLENLRFDSYQKLIRDLELGEIRLFSTDNILILPVNTNIIFFITSSDVIHSWAVPSLGIKLDANPGFLGTISSNFPVIGNFYGSCAELCGANHRFIPINLEITTLDLFRKYLLGLI